MKPLQQQSLVIAFVIASTIVNLMHFWELIGWFSLAAIAFGGLQWALSQEHSEISEDAETDLSADASEVTYPEQALARMIEEVAIGTDLWETPESDAVEESEPTPQLQQEGGSDETPSQFQLIMQQLESLPQKKGRRKVWMALCDRLHIKGAGKVRDANLSNKASFLESQNVKVPELVKAKVVALRAA